MLSFDIQMEIMKRLPVKSLIQFRSVCKAWKSFIDSSHFITGYDGNKHRQQHLMIMYEVENEVKYVSFVDDDDTFPEQKFALTVSSLLQEKEARIIGSSHGLLCLHCYSSKTQMAVLWNPTIRKSIGVALPNVLSRPFHYVIGFGVRPDTKDPMIVKITCIIDDYRDMESISSIPCQVMVFTLSSRKWTSSSSTNHLPRKSIGFTSFQTVIGKFIYWLARDRIAKDGRYSFHKLMIMSFDLKTREFREVDVPVSLCTSFLSISRLRESLVLLKYNINLVTKKYAFDVWMMEHGDPKAFTKIFTIRAPNASIAWTLGFRKNGEPIIEMKNNVDFGDDDRDEKDYDSAIVVYEPFSERIKDLGIYGNVYSINGGSYEYTESLLLLDHDDGHILR